MKITFDVAKKIFLNRGFVAIDGGQIFDGNKWREAVVVISKWLEQEPCEDTISRQAAIDAFERFIHELGIEDEPYNYGEMALSAKNVPPVTPKPKIGHWIVMDEGFSPYECSECGTVEFKKSKYCPNCGAKMIEPQERSDKE